MPRKDQKYCKRGHLLDHNRYIVKSKHKKCGVESGCRRCKSMRQKYYYYKKEMKAEGIDEQVPELEEYAKEYFEQENL